MPTVEGSYCYERALMVDVFLNEGVLVARPESSSSIIDLPEMTGEWIFLS